MLRKFLQFFGGLAIVLTLFRFIALDYWWVRMFDFPHVQLTVLVGVALATYFIRFDRTWKKDYLFVLMLLACFIYQVVRIIPFTPLAAYEVLDTTEDDANQQLSIYSANVLQKNKKRAQLLQELQTTDADVLLFMETNTAWQQEITAVLPESYQYRVEYPLDNTYGILMYSKKELISPEVKFMIDDSIPSIHTRLRLDNNEIVQLYAIHPTPPMPMHNPMSTDRDQEMMLTATLARQSDLPVIVLGDFNDVAWSQTTRLFQRVSELLDPRKGRGLFNTYNADNPILRWPLDHLFVSKEFRVVAIERGKDIHSDHFPIYAKLSLEPKGAAEQAPKPPNQQDLKDAKEQIKGNQFNLSIDPLQ
ncbi:endonuclease/exonuclease/phosphatase family protein [Altibacter sp. HG106]|uniref:endonuclease/exonuclease/phosphatase family protein n=1 Tax=Altibacter sp. HG106 TaxID=3023937 RepID=UPI0023503ACF|nr:endonuclease/exonuclease/phosphatase family protein [Altibacter sp. HG106]MDC7993577.1 endonuclease/exonuclease/phosphatase family protein [Altibacter sp. HG106]